MNCQRSYTLRGHDPVRQRVVVDFVLHERNPGPATRWALRATPGDMLARFGPSAYFSRPVPLRQSFVAADWLLLAGDETALPAIGAILESLPADARGPAYVEIPEPADQQELRRPEGVATTWLHRSDGPAGACPLLDAIRTAAFPPGRVFAWLAGEAGVVRSLRRHLVEERGIAKSAIEFTGHWRRSRSQDDAPTAEDLAEAQERLAAGG